tara:strand:- start:35122 stop:35973 length:852 start_codon:yes stop_codon:yes gene_type:complete
MIVHGNPIFKFCTAIVFLVVCFLLVMERTNISKTAEVTGMESVMTQTKRDLARLSKAIGSDEQQYVTPMGKVYKREHKGYTLYISCDHKGPLFGFMRLGKDTGNLPREDKFTFDDGVPAECRQASTGTYNRTYHRGHLFAANHFDDDKQEMFESFYMSNVVPQHVTSNTGAWKATEVITECYREFHDVYVAAGVIYGSEADDDYFVDSHGVTTPTAMWKVIMLDDESYAGWIIPNNGSATFAKLDSFSVAIDDIMRITNIRIATDAGRLKRVSLPIFENCHRS